MIIGLTLLTGLDFLANSWKKSTIIEQHYYQQYNQASSSLNWAVTQDWQPPSNHWQCKTEPILHLRVCIKLSLLKIDNYTLIRGEADDFSLYMLAHYDNHKLLVEKGHWLDYCPEKRNSDCE
ncbi:hypothetical protein GAPWKB11_0368 [Gilliamella apicola]|nr:hypothetical protein GAPWKB11_0368 [Gilliamella apicola]